MDQVRMIHGSCHVRVSTLRFSHFCPVEKIFFPSFCFGKGCNTIPWKHTWNLFCTHGPGNSRNRPPIFDGKGSLFFGSFCLGTVFLLALSIWKDGSIQVLSHMKKMIPVCFNCSQGGVKTKESIIAVEFFFSTFGHVISFSFLLRDHQRVHSLMLDLRMNGRKRRTLFLAKGFAFQETASKHPKSPKPVWIFQLCVCLCGCHLECTLLLGGSSHDL